MQQRIAFDFSAEERNAGEALQPLWHPNDILLSPVSFLNGPAHRRQVLTNCPDVSYEQCANGGCCDGTHACCGDYCCDSLATTCESGTNGPFCCPFSGCSGGNVDPCANSPAGYAPCADINACCPEAATCYQDGQGQASCYYSFSSTPYYPSSTLPLSVSSTSTPILSSTFPPILTTTFSSTPIVVPASSTTSTSTSPVPSPPSSSLSSGAIGGIAGGASGASLILVFLIWYWIRKCIERRQSKATPIIIPSNRREWPGPSDEYKSKIRSAFTEVSIWSMIAGSAAQRKPTAKEEARRAEINAFNAKVYQGLAIDSASDIRVVLLQRAKSLEAEIVCKLTRIPMGSQYTALSYCWGDPCDVIPITVNGMTFRATVSLVAALRRLRRADSAVVIWIDAICINQGDPKEKKAEIRRMREIYAGATSTAIWLGEETAGSKKFCDLADKMNQAWAKEKESISTADRLARLLWTHTDDYMSLQDIVERPWFIRLWVVQEVVASARPLVLCGDRWLEFDLIPIMLQVAYDNKVRIMNRSQLFRRVEMSIMVLWLYRQELRQGNELDLMFWMWMFACDRVSAWYSPNDKIFALLSIASDKEFPALRNLDYEKPSSLVYREATQHIVSKSNGDLDFLYIGRGPNRNKLLDSDLPSWCPDFTQPSWESAISLGRSPLSPKPIYSASSAWTGHLYLPMGTHQENYYAETLDHDEPIFVESGRVLVVPGIAIDEITAVGQAYDLDDFNTSWLSGGPISEASQKRHQIVMKEMAQMTAVHAGNDLSKPYPTSGSYWNAFSRTLVCDVNLEGERCNEGEGFLPTFTNVPGGPANVTDSFLDRGRLTPASMNLHLRRLRRRFITTEAGLIGLAPVDTRPDDLVCVLRGSSVPTILRRKTRAGQPGRDGVERYTLIGESYVHGVMDGEIIALMENNHRTNQFRLKAGVRGYLQQYLIE